MSVQNVPRTSENRSLGSGRYKCVTAGESTGIFFERIKMAEGISRLRRKQENLQTFKNAGDLEFNHVYIMREIIGLLGLIIDELDSLKNADRHD